MESSATVLFLCPHNAAKSLLAAADFDRMASARGLPFRADSAGTEPAERPSPAVVAALQAEGIDVAGYRPRLVTAKDVAGSSWVISMGCDIDDLPATSIRLVRWDDIPPVSDDLGAARNAIQRHVEALVDDLAEEQTPAPSIP